MSYATLQDVYDLGFTARAFAIVPRAWNSDNGRSGDAIDITNGTGVIRMAGHGYAPADLVEFVLVGNPSLPGSMVALPAGATSGVLLTPTPIDFFRFALRNPLGALVTYTSAGVGWALQLDPERRLQRHLDDAQSRIDRALVAQSPPIKVDPVTGKYPAEVIGINARIAARSAIPTMAFENLPSREPVDRIEALRAADEKMLEEWSLGKPLLPHAVDQDGIADDALRGVGGAAPPTGAPRYARRPVGWARGGCL